MKNNLILLEKKYNYIKNLGWIKSIKNNCSGIGRTFENLLGKEEDSFCFPDFNGIKIKTKHFYSKKPFTLFSAEPDGKELFESERIRATYGYPHTHLPEFLIFYSKVKAIHDYTVGKYKFTLKIDYNKKILSLIIKDFQNNIVDTNTYWSFDLLKECLKRKLTYLAVILARSKYIDGIEYFQYCKMVIYKNVVFEKFLKLLKEGKISVNFNISVYTGTYRYGKPHNHGTSFNIYGDCIKELYECCYSVD